MAKEFEANDNEFTTKFYYINYHHITQEYDEVEDDYKLKHREEKRICASVSQSHINDINVNSYGAFILHSKLSEESIKEFKNDRSPIVLSCTGSCSELAIVYKIREINNSSFTYVDESGKVVSNHLRNRMWELLNKQKEDITCPISLEPIKSLAEFKLLGCGHYFSSDSIKKLKDKVCPVCKSCAGEMFNRMCWCSDD